MRPISTAPTDRRPRGTSLIEITVASALILMVFLGVYLILDKGLRFYRLNSDANDRQREALAFLSRLNTVMQNSRSSLVYPECATAPVVAAPTPTLYDFALGISCAVALTPDGKAQFEAPPQERLLWQGYVVFFLNPQRELRYLRRENSAIPAVGGPTPDPQSPQVVGMVPSALMTASPSTLLCKEVTRLAFTHHHKDEDLGGGRKLRSDYFDVVLECGKQNDPLGYWIQLRTACMPRN